MSTLPPRARPTALFAGQLVVVETEDDQFLGSVDVVDIDDAGWLRVRTGLRGHPHLVDPRDVVSLVLASEHPLTH